jgi:hypothetical protein
MTDTDDTKPAAAHTPEPWHYEMDYSVTTIFAPDPAGQNPYYVAEIDGQDVGRFATREQHEANARRLVAAVNACRGLSTEALEQGVVAELLEALQAQQMAEYDPEASRRKGYFDRARELRCAALAKAASG